MEKIRERFKQKKPSCESVRLRKRSSILYSTDVRKPQTLKLFGISITVFTVIFRLLNCVLVQTSFVPDEYWQSLEIPHRIILNIFLTYGYETWEWKEGIRGYFYPLLFALMYKLLHLMNYDTMFVPRVFQALLAAYADVKLYNLILHWDTPAVAKWTYFCQLCSWFTWFCCSRTLTNTMETVLTTLALCFYPLPGSKTYNSWKYLSLVSLAVIVRPTALIVWLPLLFYHFCVEQNKLKLVVQRCFPIAALALGVSTLIDSVFYGKWVLVQWNFLKFNVLHNVAALRSSSVALVLHSGSARRDRPASPSLPARMFTGHQKAQNPAHNHLMDNSRLQEFRFVYPVLPFCMIFCGMSLAKLQTWRKPAAAALLLFNLIPALYTGLIHQRGSLDVMHDLRQLCDASDTQNSTELLFLMPCHSTPLYSHLHCPLTLRFLECPPDLTGNEEYVDEADVFFSNPLHWLQTSFPSQSTLPSHIVLFDALEKDIASFLEENRFAKQAEIFHTHFPEGRLGRNILIYTRGSETTN
ncbi:GPI mannosyltransferase 3 [Labeo rohita]|uniref:Mannosyltransferase n=1 Tax=Labeo rohita TaxID=84645 RepID=A0ABQ8LSU8_LABRO|nr:GPI mannosyltransferase 3 [Labeo rohita]